MASDVTTNHHSLRATAVTRLYAAEVDEQLIKETTGHRSDYVRNYKCTSTQMKGKASKIVQGSKSTSMSANKVIRGDNTISVTVNIQL